MNKFSKLYNEYIEKPVLKFDGKIIDLYVDREDFLQLLEYGKQLEQVLDKIKEIPLKHIDNANEELQIILRNNNDLEYKNQCSHDFDIIRQNVEMIYKDILELLEEIK